MTIPVINDLSCANIDLIVPQGSEVQFFYQIFTDVAMTLPMDLTAFTALAQIRKYSGSTIIEAVIPITIGCTVTNGVIVPASPTLGGISLNFNASVTTPIPYREEGYFYDIFLVDSNSVQRMIMQGSFTLVNQITEF